LPAPLGVLCGPAITERLDTPAALAREMLLRAYRADEWPRWFDAAWRSRRCVVRCLTVRR